MDIGNKIFGARSRQRIAALLIIVVMGFAAVARVQAQFKMSHTS